MLFYDKGDGSLVNPPQTPPGLLTKEPSLLSHIGDIFHLLHDQRLYDVEEIPHEDNSCNTDRDEYPEKLRLHSLP